mmetsp:Transcript_52100/g.151386  ORF Transcript_52100/g.151386 Transcript_52100/m.151386 type:complete len:452 (-) Transcript_52100:71-1426(-)
MQIPPQEDWSPELLSELQRAVPVLESGSLELSAGRRGHLGSPLPGEGTPTAPARDSPVEGFSLLSLGGSVSSHHTVDGSLTWGSLAADAGGSFALHAGSSVASTPADMLSDDAMALPLSTLTSGKRRTYANRSTFQAHVCCVMDPQQVAPVLETLRSNPSFQSSRSWPHAFRVISPFDRQTHEGCDDDGDVGAGEKMLGLLQRMGLENLLLIVCRWDSGPHERLGVELFRCVCEQCKELLRELQRAVRASFPPEELMGARRQEHSAAEVASEISSDEPQAFTFRELVASEGSDFTVLQEEGPCIVRGRGGAAAPVAGACAAATRLLDLRDLGPTPPAELVYAARGVYAQPRRHRPTQTAKLQIEDSAATRWAPVAPQRPVPEPWVRRCALSPRRAPPRGRGPPATSGCQDRSDGSCLQSDALRLPKVLTGDLAVSSPAKLDSARAMRSALG